MPERRRDARNAIEISAMFGFVLIGLNQLSFGAQGSQVVQEGFDWQAQKVFAVLLIIGAGAVLVSEFVQGLLGAYWERGGMLGCAIALGVYSFSLPVTIQSWNTSFGVVFAVMSLGCAVRAWNLHRRIRRFRAMQRWV